MKQFHLLKLKVTSFSTNEFGSFELAHKMFLKKLTFGCTQQCS